MNLRTHLSRSNGYRELGMFDESILILEDIPFEEDRWHPLVVEARYKTYRDAEQWELAIIMAKLKHESKPNNLEWLLNYADGLHQMGDTKKAIACLKDAEGRFGENAEYLFRLGKYHALLGEVEEAKNLVRRAFKLDGSFKADFLDDPAFDSVWESF
jgi:tetratricopeptide (TPR) repeat protein